MHQRLHSPLRRATAAALIVTTIVAPLPATAQVSKRPALADRPLMSAGNVRPNVMFTLDTAISMRLPWVSNVLNRDRLDGMSNASNIGESPHANFPYPKDESVDSGANGTQLEIGNDPSVYSPRVNKLWYDHTRTYEPGVHWNGSPLPNVSPVSAPYEGYRSAVDPDGVLYGDRAGTAAADTQVRALDLTQTCEAWMPGNLIALTTLSGRTKSGAYYPSHITNQGGSYRWGKLPGSLTPAFTTNTNHLYDDGTYCTWSMGSNPRMPAGLPAGRTESGVPIATVARYAFWYRYVERQGSRWTDLDGSTKSCTQSNDPHTPWCETRAVCDGSEATLRDARCYQRIDIMRGGIGVGESKSDISPNARASYPKAPTRTDCKGTTCTYEEEIQNYANWFSYHRTRQTAMKTHLGRQFAAIPAGTSSPFRIGFNVTNRNVAMGSGETDFNTTLTQDPSNTHLFLDVEDWTEAHKKQFFRSLYGARVPVLGPPSYPASTAVKIGEYFRGKGSKDPMRYSCQPALHVFATDTAREDGAIDRFTPNVFPAIDQPYAGNNNGDLDGHPGNPLATRASASLDVSGKRNELSDVAMFYISKDLRSPAQGNCKGALPGIDLCVDNVVPSGKLNFRHQHLRTSVIGVGFEGKPYREDYETSNDPNDTIVRIRNGLDNWLHPYDRQPSLGRDQWKARVDDYWHAAINGRGTYFNPKTPPDLSRALSAVLGDLVAGSPASAAGSVVSTPVLVNGQQAYAYGVRFYPGEWTGDVYRRKIDPITGGDVGGDEWNTRNLLDALAAGDGWDKRRKIVTTRDGAAVPFRPDRLSDAQLRALAESSNDALWNNLSKAQRDVFGSRQAFRAAVVNYLRGDRTHEIGGSGAQVFRKRVRLLGDIVGSEAVYVARPREKYTDATNPGYAQLIADNEKRRPMLYVAANDGMLHAINAETGQEEWAFIPSVIIDPTKGGLIGKSTLGELAFPDRGVPPFAKQFYADGTPVVSDVDFSRTAGASSSTPDWRSILVAGLNKGGSGIYALDVTNADTPGAEAGVAAAKVLWEWNGDRAPGQVGYTFGKPIVTKTRAWGWVVIVPSGMSNADGKGNVFVLNARTGQQLFRFTTGEGSDSDPSGLAFLAGYSASFADATVEQVYGADLRGNLWRFDLSRPTPPIDEKGTKVATFTNPGSPALPQAVTTRLRVEFDSVSGKRWLFVGTGRLLDQSDAEPSALASTQTQTFYAIPDGDRYTPAPISRPVTRADLLNVSNSLDGDSAAAQKGWYEDFAPGERVIVDPRFDVGVILYAASKPSDDQCSAGFSSRLFARKAGDAKSVLYEATGSTRLRSLSVPEGIVKIDTVTLASGETVARLTTVSGDGRGQRIENPRDPRGLGRISWREITAE